MLGLIVSILKLREPRGLRLLADAESATAHCYQALSLQCRGETPWGKSNSEVLGSISQKEFAHCRQLLLLLRANGEEEYADLLSRPAPAQRPGWTPESRYSVGLSNCLAWRILFGEGLLEMSEAKAMEVVGIIEGLHVALYRILAIGASEEHWHTFAAIAADEMMHQVLVAADHPLSLVSLRAKLLLPLAVLVFVTIDWPNRISKFAP